MAENILAFEAGIDWDVTRVKGGTAGMLAGGLFNIHLRGSGNGRSALRWRAGPARRLGGTHLRRPQAAIAWSGGVSTTLKTDVQVKTMVGLGSGESFQLGFSGKGWVLVQPSEGRPLPQG